MSDKDKFGNIASSAVGAGLGILFGEYNDRRQIRQQGKLINQQLEANKSMANYNYDLAMKYWEDTNYARQREQMEKAGLNVGMMYGGGGNGGQSMGISGSVGAAGAAQHGNEMGMGIQFALMNAQKENIEADTKLKEANAEKTAGVDTEKGFAEIGKIVQDTKNAGVQNEIMQFNKTVEELNAKFLNETIEERVKNVGLQNSQIENNVKKLVQDTEQAVIQNKISRETASETIKQAKLQSIAMSLQNEILREQRSTQVAMTEEKYKAIEKMSAEILRMSEQTRQGDTSLDQNQQRLLMDMWRTNFETGSEAQMVRWLNAATGIARIGLQAGSMTGGQVPRMTPDRPDWH